MRSWPELKIWFFESFALQPQAVRVMIAIVIIAIAVALVIVASVMEGRAGGGGV